MNQSQIASAGSPRSAAICSGTLCRCGFSWLTASAVAVDGIHLDQHVRTDAGQRPVLDDPDPGADHGHPVPVRVHARLGRFGLPVRVPGLEDRPEPVADLRRREREEQCRRRPARARTGGSRASETAARSRRTRPPTRFCSSVVASAASSAGSTSIGQTRSCRAEHDARRSHAGDQHQLSRIRHVEPERSARPLAEVVELEDAELDDADRRAERRRR